MEWSEISFRPSTKVLARFGAVTSTLLLFIGLREGALKHRILSAAIFAVAALVVAFAAAVKPALMRPVLVGLTVATFPLAWIMSRVVLTLVFYGLFTPLALLFRLVRRDALRRKLPGEGSCWTPRSQPNSLQSYFRQF